MSTSRKRRSVTENESYDEHASKARRMGDAAAQLMNVMKEDILAWVKTLSTWEHRASALDILYDMELISDDVVREAIRHYVAADGMTVPHDEEGQEKKDEDEDDEDSDPDSDSDDDDDDEEDGDDERAAKLAKRWNRAFKTFVGKSVAVAVGELICLVPEPLVVRRMRCRFHDLLGHAAAYGSPAMVTAVLEHARWSTEQAQTIRKQGDRLEMDWPEHFHEEFGVRFDEDMSLLEKAVVGSNEECFVALLNLKKAPYTADDMRRALVFSEFTEVFVSAAARSLIVPEVDDVYVKRAEEAVQKMGTYGDEEDEQDDDDGYPLSALALLVTKQATGHSPLHVYHALKQISEICYSSMGFGVYCSTDIEMNSESINVQLPIHHNHTGIAGHPGVQLRITRMKDTDSKPMLDDAMSKLREGLAILKAEAERVRSTAEGDTAPSEITTWGRALVKIAHAAIGVEVAVVNSMFEEDRDDDDEDVEKDAGRRAYFELVYASGAATQGDRNAMMIARATACACISLASKFWCAKRAACELRDLVREDGRDESTEQIYRLRAVEDVIVQSSRAKTVEDAIAEAKLACYVDFLDDELALEPEDEVLRSVSALRHFVLLGAGDEPSTGQKLAAHALSVAYPTEVMSGDGSYCTDDDDGLATEVQTRLRDIFAALRRDPLRVDPALRSMIRTVVRPAWRQMTECE